MKIFELTPVNNRKSFYGKCRVIETKNVLTLQSYTSNVANFNKETKKLTVSKLDEHLTNTTLTHINAFFVYCGFSKMTKKEIKNL